MKIALTLVHNKTPEENEAQIQTLLTHLSIVPVEETVDIYDDEGNITGQETVVRQSYRFKALDLPHELLIYQVIPFGTPSPESRYVINSGGIVSYGQGDEDKTGEHPRFFNWGMKRGIDNGADISLYFRDITQLSARNLLGALAKVRGSTGLIEAAWGKAVTRRTLREVGQLEEGRSFSQAITNLKMRVVETGLSNE